jgi:hypothetical protein
MKERLGFINIEVFSIKDNDKTSHRMGENLFKRLI